MTSRLRREVTRALYVVDRAWEQLVGWRRLGIRRRDLVLDVGSGGHPFIRADVLCDKFLFDHSQRQRGESSVVDRPMVAADAAHLPFRDRTFDFSHSSHLLEHLDDPAAHLLELERGQSTRNRHRPLRRLGASVSRLCPSLGDQPRRLPAAARPQAGSARRRAGGPALP